MEPDQSEIIKTITAIAADISLIKDDYRKMEYKIDKVEETIAQLKDETRCAMENFKLKLSKLNHEGEHNSVSAEGVSPDGNDGKELIQKLGSFYTFFFYCI